MVTVERIGFERGFFMSKRDENNEGLNQISTAESKTNFLEKRLGINRMNPNCMDTGLWIRDGDSCYT